MINKVFISRDFLYDHTKSQKNNLLWVFLPMKFQIEQSINKNIETFNYDTDSGNDFSRKIFFDKSNIEFNEKKNKFPFQSEQINTESLDYLKSFLDNSLVIFYEASFETQKILDKINVTYINFYNHSIHFLEDVFFAIRSNNIEINQKLSSYKVDERLFNIYANYFKTFIDFRNLSAKKSSKLNIQDNSALLCAQTLHDKSVEHNSKFLNLLDFTKRINEISKHYSRIYYVPHPKENKADKLQIKINKYINSCDYITKLEEFSSYEIIAHNNIKKVIAISSSILFEAKYFGKEVEYLYQPFFHMSDDFGPKNFIRIYNDYFKISFWSDILSPIIKTNKKVKDIDFISHNNRIRNLRPNQLYWGYKSDESINKLSTKIDKLENRRMIKKFNKFIRKLKNQFNWN